jgi:D-sedoheptulose 7-phosphate isomerase
MIQNELQELIETLRHTEGLIPTIDAAGRALIQGLRNGNKILTCGNGGSAADALHMAEEFTGRYKGDRRSLPAICLAADITALTCIANDYGFDAIFSRQVQSLGKPGDLFVGFTTSGNSRNVVEAVHQAKAQGLVTIILSGRSGGVLKSIPDFELIVPSETTARIQEVHTFILHQWLEMVEQEVW